MSRTFFALFSSVVIFSILFVGCEKSSQAKVQVEKLQDIRPSLPEVPTIPPSPYPTQYPDGSHSVYGLRKQLRHVIENQVTVTGFVAKVYEPPPCPKGERCAKASAPHVWLADRPDETDATKLLLMAGYAENQEQIDEAIARAKKGLPPEMPAEGTRLLPIPADFLKGAKVKVKGRFAFMTGGGFQSSDGVLDYGGHEVIQPAEGMPMPLPAIPAKK
jgi:hypothetical protein